MFKAYRVKDPRSDESFEIEEITVTPSGKLRPDKSGDSGAPTEDCCCKPAWWRLVTVEPVIFAFFVVYSLQENVIPALVIDRLEGDTLEGKFCNASFISETDSVHRRAAEWSKYMQLITSVPCVLVVTILGTYSDKYDRKLPIILPSLGFFLNSFLLFADAFLWDKPTQIRKIDYLLIFFVPIGLTGNHMSFMMAVSSYISDSSSSHTRTVRLAIMEMAKTLGLFFGQIVQGQMASHFGFHSVFAFSCAMSVFAILFTLFGVKEIERENKSKMNWDSISDIKDILHFRNFGRCLKSCFVRGSTKETAVITVLILSLSLTYFTMAGESNVGYFYVNRRFCILEGDYGYLKACMALGGCFGLAVVLPFIRTYIKPKDEVLGMISFADVSVRPLIIAVAETTWLLYFANLTCWMYEVTGASVRSSVSQIVTSDEIGKVFSVAAIVDAIAPSLAGFVYPILYRNTLDSTCFYLSFCILFLGVPSLFIVWLIKKKMGLQVQSSTVINSFSKPSVSHP